jgi:hypothetical protein
LQYAVDVNDHVLAGFTAAEAETLRALLRRVLDNVA